MITSNFIIPYYISTESQVSQQECTPCSVAQSRLTLCNPMDCSLSGSSVYGIFQARILESVAFPMAGIFLTQDRTHIYCIGRQILYHCATWEKRRERFELQDGLIWWSRGQLRICLPKQGTWVRSLAGELRSHTQWAKPTCQNY